jgi:cysteinyl-tRNA synthetase
MAPLLIYNSATQKKEIFTPLTPGEVKMYVCGPTVYGFLHVGNFRGAIFFNLVRNWLEQIGYKVTFAYNFTDVDDKIIIRANEEGVPSSEVSERYISEFKKDFSALGLRPHSVNPKVTEFMEPIKAMVQDLIDRDMAYVTEDGEVLYAVRRFRSYGKLSNKNVDDLNSGARVEVDGKKRDPLDFALWKPAKPGEPEWPSPWSAGRPGWHIECSAMIRALMGDSIDIHGGGMDLIFPHHENEIAQSEGATGKPFVRYWMHNNMLTFGDRKMSKSLGNIKSGRDFLNETNPEIFKYLILSVHYRSLSDFSDEAIDRTISSLARIYSSLALAEGLLEAGPDVAPSAAPLPNFQKALGEAEAQITAALNDDFNTPEVMASVFNLVRLLNSSFKPGQKLSDSQRASVHAITSTIRRWGSLMALFQEPPKKFLVTLDDMLLLKMGLSRSEIDGKVAERSQVRAAKDFKRSDELRAELVALGVSVSDTPQGSIWEVTK